MKQLPAIEFKKAKQNPTLDSVNSLYELPFFKTEEYFSNYENYINFIKAVEKVVRASSYYNKYLKYVKEELSLVNCSVWSNISEEMATIELHHGPILTLFDVVAIMLDWSIYHGKKITTFRLASEVLQEHFNNNVQFVMLSKTAHQAVHEGAIFINMKQAFGNLNRFLEKYSDGLQREQIYKINKYIELSKQHDSYDNNLFKLNDQVKSWSKDILI